MDEDKSSFLYLPNNVTSQRYVSNTPSHFKIPLAKPLNFRNPHNWEVSLSELYFPSSYYNISQDKSNLTIQYHIKGVVHTKNITIPQGHYDPASYVKEVNKEIKKIKHKFTATSEPKVLFKGRLKYSPNSRKITLVLNNHLEAMKFYGDDLRNMLGLEKANDPGDLTIKFEKDELRSMREYYYEFPKSCSFNYKGAHMYVYSSLVKDSIVGNVFAPIVRVVGLEDESKSETIHREFTVPHYLPLRSSSFNEVVLESTDGMGNSMKFNQGNSVAVFHFRKKSKI